MCINILTWILIETENILLYMNDKMQNPFTFPTLFVWSTVNHIVINVYVLM